MNRKDIINNKLIYLSSLGFMALCAFMFSLTFFLFSNLSNSIDGLMEIGKTPDYIQMHEGEINKKDIETFAESTKDVEDVQVLSFLNIENSQVILNGHPLVDSSQDNGICTQSERFDYLLDLDNKRITANDGEIYVPVCYKGIYDLEVGQVAFIENKKFIIAGFLRDSQMTSMMASSKRFLVSQQDFEALIDKGNNEYLIEFLLSQQTNVDHFSLQYNNAQLPSNGPTITKPLIKLISGLSDGMMIVVVLFCAITLLMISILCIHFVTRIAIENDKKEIGILKAIGLSSKQIRKKYLEKYIYLSFLGALLGIVAAYGFQQPLSLQTKVLYGTGSNKILELFMGIVGGVLAQSIILISIYKTMKRIRNMSAVSILSGRNVTSKGISTKRKLGGVSCLVVGLCVMMVLVPMNVLSTISSDQFVNYMGIGNADIRLDITDSKNIKQIEKYLTKNKGIKHWASFTSYSCQVDDKDGLKTPLIVEKGNHSLFPVSYIEGHLATKEKELALSYLYANENGYTVGDTIWLNGEEYVVCGIYSDITNGGKSAKVFDLKIDDSPIWNVIYISLNSSDALEVRNMKEELLKEGVDEKVTSIQEYVNNTYGPTISLVQKSSVIASIVAMSVAAMVMYLFIRLMIALDREEISIQKAIGLQTKHIQRQYFKKMIILSLFGIGLGILFGNELADVSLGFIFEQFGAAGFHFIKIGLWVWFGIPILFILLCLLCIYYALRHIQTIQAIECLKGRG